MKRIIVLLLITVSTQAAAQTAGSWYKSFTGYVGKAKFTLHLHKAGNEYDAYIYYDSTQQPYQVSGSGLKNTSILLTGAPGKEYDIEKWNITITGKKMKGSLIINNKSTLLTASEDILEPGAGFVFTEQKKALGNEKNAPVGIFFQSGIWYTGNSKLNKILWPFIKTPQTPGQYLLREKNVFIQGFLNEQRDLMATGYAESSVIQSRESHIESLISYASKYLLNITSSSYEYSGGAHGIFNTSHIVIDKRHIKRLVLTDIISDTAQLTALMDKYFRRQYKVEPDISLIDFGLFVSSIHPNDNFFFTKGCIGFTYNPYEIGPYAMGEAIIYIPLADCNLLLTTTARELITN